MTQYCSHFQHRLCNLQESETISLVILFTLSTYHFSFQSLFNNSGLIDKKSPTLTLKILTYLKNNPDSFHSKFNQLELNEFRKFINFLSDECGAWKYKERGKANSTISDLSKSYGNIKRWYNCLVFSINEIKKG